MAVFVGGLVLLGVAGYIAFRLAPDWFASDAICRRPTDRNCLDANAQAQDRRGITTATLALFAGALGALGAFYTARTFELNRELAQHDRERDRASHALDRAGQITERFTRAIDQLGRPELDIRLGGIYGLERIARDSVEDYPQVIEVLTAFAREHAPWPPSRPQPGNSGPLGLGKSDTEDGDIHALERIAIRALDHLAKASKAETDITTTSTRAEQLAREPETEPLKLATDVQAVLSVLGRRNRDQEQNRRLTLNLSPSDLRGADLRGALLRDADLSHAQLEGADLTAALLRDADLSHAQLQGADLTAAQLQGADLSHAQLQGADLTAAQLQGANLIEASLQGADLRTAGLQRAWLGLAQMQKANLGKAGLQGAILIRAQLEEADLREADLQGACVGDEGIHSGYANLQKADLTGAQLQGANLAGADLRGVDLTGASLQGANLRRADLRGANLAQARLEKAIYDDETRWPDEFESPPDGALFMEKRSMFKEGYTDSARLKDLNLSQELLPDARLIGAQLQGANLSGASLQGASLGNADLQGADLSRAQLQRADLGAAKLQGADLSWAQLQGASLSIRSGALPANLGRADLTAAQLQGANLAGVDLQGANLFGASLQGSELAGVDLRGANLSEVDMRGANLAGAQLRGADLSGAWLLAANLSDAQLREAVYDDKTRWPESLDPAVAGAKALSPSRRSGRPSFGAFGALRRG